MRSAANSSRSVIGRPGPPRARAVEAMRARRASGPSPRNLLQAGVDEPEGSGVRSRPCLRILFSRTIEAGRHPTLRVWLTAGPVRAKGSVASRSHDSWRRPWGGVAAGHPMTRTRRTSPARGLSAGDEDSFICCNCGSEVLSEALGTRHRNHCPRCLWSRHLDLRPGDRRCVCRGAMAPIAVWIRDDGEGALIHRCTRCGGLGSNRIAGDDDPRALRSLTRQISGAVEGLTRGGDHDRLA